jgi:hypothetical protein
VPRNPAKPTPQQLSEIREIASKCADSQDKLITKKGDPKVAFLLPKMVEVVDETDEDGNTTGYSSKRYIGRIAKIGEANWRMLIAETKHQTDIANGKTTGHRSCYIFAWTADNVSDAFRRVFEQQDEQTLVHKESISAIECLQLTELIEDFAAESNDAVSNGAKLITDQLFKEKVALIRLK